MILDWTQAHLGGPGHSRKNTVTAPTPLISSESTSQRIDNPVGMESRRQRTKPILLLPLLIRTLETLAAFGRWAAKLPLEPLGSGRSIVEHQVETSFPGRASLSAPAAGCWQRNCYLLAAALLSTKSMPRLPVGSLYGTFCEEGFFARMESKSPHRGSNSVWTVASWEQVPLQEPAPTGDWERPLTQNKFCGLMDSTNQETDQGP